MLIAAIVLGSSPADIACTSYGWSRDPAQDRHHDRAEGAGGFKFASWNNLHGARFYLVSSPESIALPG